MTAVRRETTLPRVSALDGLRGVAVAGVVLFHGGHLIGGYLGVDLFFVLSGFLITSLLLVESGDTGGIGLGHFWARRARRLLPALVVMLLAVCAYCVVFATQTELAGIRGDALATLTYVANWRAIFTGQDYWALFTAPSPLQHTWSLAIEEQFYLVWPLVFVGLLAWFGRRAPLATFVVALVGAAVSGLLLAVLYDPLNVSRAYYGTDTRAGAVLLGAAFAAALVIWGPVRGRVARVLVELAGLAGVIVLALAWTRVDGQSEWLYRGGFTLCGVAVVAVIAAAAHPEAGLLSRALSWRPLCLLGLISYGVYLWHWPVDVVVNPGRTGLDGWTLFAVQVALTLVIAITSYLVVEQPIRHGAGTTHFWRLAAPATAVVVVAVVLLVTVGGGPTVVEAPATIAAAVAEERRAPPTAATTMVVGNSVAFYLANAMRQVAPPATDVILNRAHVACVFPTGATAENQKTLSRVVKNPIPCDTDWTKELAAFHPDRVVMLNWYGGDSSYLYGGYWMQACDASYDRLYRARLTAAVRKFESAGAQVVLVTSPYGEYVAGQTPQARDRVDCANRTVTGVARAEGAQLVDLKHLVCPHGSVCLEQIYGQTLRYDGVHFSGEGGRIVARWLLGRMTPLPAVPSNPASGRPSASG